jgi:ATP-dependent helicase/nuclease subunit A
MIKPDIIPLQIRDLQRAVADPAVSAWVAANAGSGKTHVLAQRVINLLLEGVAPEKILCITFTKAAAANMAKRVFDTLAEWTTLDDAALDESINSRSEIEPNAPRRALARRLFARALETPGGLKVQTIHAFCTQLLHQFPFEANVAARFDVLDETEQTQLLERLTLDLLLEAARTPQSPIGRALEAAITAASDQSFRDAIRAAITAREAVARWVIASGGVEAAVAAMSRQLGLEPGETRDSVEDEFFIESLIAPSEWPAIAAALEQGGKSDRDQARRFRQLASLPRSDCVEVYLDIFCTANERAARRSIVTQGIKDKDLVERLATEQVRVCALLERLRAVICRDRSAALLTIVYEILRHYQSEKDRRGLLDYDDLIDKTLALLGNVDAAWVHYKLDFGVDHLLMDEAQDTSSKQWLIVRNLVAEFTAGVGARPATRTVFAVGDEKQSIYSFQNAAPKEFAEMRRHFERTHQAGRRSFVFHEFKHSFRSGANILAAVDAVFSDKTIAASVSSDTDGFPPHIALPVAPPGLVEIWEPVEPEKSAEIDGWDAPFDQVSETSPRVRLARRIARTVRRLVEAREPVVTQRRALRYGDVLVLVRQRGELFEAIIRALKNENVEVAGADRLMLTEHIAVMDLMVLADALLLPDDDLALATILRSPLFGFSDDDLFALAWDRGRLPLRTALSRAGETQPFAAAAARLDKLAELAKRETPFDFYAQVLGADGARSRFLARLGPEANDALDEFLNLALEYERRETPSLQGFLAWLRQARAEVKRDMEIARDEVRVMTVHGAKGLEAPLVILADTMTPPAGPRQPRLLTLSGSAVVWAGKKADDSSAMASARLATLGQARDEYRRLLYVAMTRAADRLIICGADGERRRPDGCWYDLVRAALDPQLVEETDGGEKVLRFRPAAVESTPAAPAAAPAKTAEPELPSWLRQAVPVQAPRPVPLAPSTAFDDEIARTMPGTAGDRQKALQRGQIVHRLMQSLPDIAPAARKSALEHYLGNAARDLSPDERAEIARHVLATLEDDKFADVFAAGSRPEVPIVGRISRPNCQSILVAGQVDRLIAAEAAVLVVDYKTDSLVPDRLDDVPPAYTAQLALYRAVLMRVYPGKSVQAALIFTAGPLLLEIPATTLDAALATQFERHGTQRCQAPVSAA